MNISIVEKSKKNCKEDFKVTCSMDIIKLKDVQAIRNAVREHLIFIGLDNRNNLRNISLLGIGTTKNLSIDSKEIVRMALLSSCDKVILVHNHPSNNLEPSKEDWHITNVTKEMLKVFNINLLDHIIVTEKDYISLEKIKEISKEKDTKSITNLKKSLLIEENKNLKQQIIELEQKLRMDLSLKIISAQYVGNYNDTTIYNVEIILNGNKENITLEKNYHDLEIPNYTWEVFSNLNLDKKEIQQIVDVVSKNPPTMFIDAPSTIYEDILEETIEMEGI